MHYGQISANIHETVMSYSVLRCMKLDLAEFDLSDVLWANNDVLRTICFLGCTRER